MASIQHRGPYQWRVQIRRKGYPTQTRTFETKTDAQAWARMVESEMDRGIYRPIAEAEHTTLLELLERYRKEVTSQKKGWLQESSKLKVVSRYPLAQYAVARIGGKELAEYRDCRLQEVSPKTVRDELVLLGHVFKVAMQDWGIILPHGNPIDSVRKPKIGNNRRDRRLNPEEEIRLLQACKEYGEPLPTIVILALETGMRRGEIASLHWDHVNLKKRVVHLQETKNDESRDVPLSSKAAGALNALPRNISGRVFEMRPDSITQAFNRACKRAGIEDLRFHDLRHEATSRFFEKGLNPMQVATITGHKTLQMLQRYTHLRAEDLAKMLG